jgi:non-canonical purine NTP pyrophosphatase (RdgB/HAM1 family)
VRRVKLLFATSNPNKVRELSAILAPLGYEVKDLSAYPSVQEPLEDGSTFAQNAQLKAVGYARQVGVPCLAEDSGLEVDALGGRPGVHSARYSGVEGPRETVDAANNALLLAELKDVPFEQRGAQFVCVFCLAQPDGRIVAEASGAFRGMIAFEAKGHNGFGYDPLFFVPDAQCTSAELSKEQKSARSHRGQAARKLATLLTTKRA